MKNLDRLIGHLVITTDYNNEYLITLRGGIFDKTSTLDLWSVANDTLTHLGERHKDFLFNMMHVQEHAEMWIAEICSPDYVRHDTEDTAPSIDALRRV